ncbi:cytosine/adenosine deaminase-related metal-dependent hydrolase [Endobacter medicaginis]|uniref:Amidohydrolase family protein n=1 Tax=Endobacter medicaginis TaxID=1181271 RepID=A0A839V2E1_9PROT|nr:amidohydrolase family protein [Endobacter medicaginis]MBB3174674.1 cytosine/adenosine deaminase-related metal-dependent hydrolase [Endobacter medicaginis]MCX5474931.1 amidohydrolase family protein [Endobacter medicaginis]NVN28941.1 amidohydrolase family protein [Endobacter medicaginis]
MRRISALCAALLAIAPVAHAEPAADPVLLVSDALLFTVAPTQPDPFMGWFSVDASGRIGAIGRGAPPATLHARDRLDAHGHWIMPGFISAHSHLWQAAYRGLAPDSTLSGWLGALYGQQAPRAETADFYWFTLYGGLDHLAHGITAAYDFNLGRPDPARAAATDGVETIDRLNFRGEADSGIRFVHGLDASDGPDHTIEAARAHVGGFLAWAATQPGHERMLSVMINGSAGFRPTPQQAVVEASLMREFHLSNQSHYLEEPVRVAEQQARFVNFESSGLLDADLGPRLIFGHFIHTNPAILAKAAAAHAAMAWNPLSNGRLASGVADIPAYLKAGLRVGMGVDGEASADLADPFENMRAGLYAIRDRHESADAMTPRDVVRLHTLGSADVLGVADRLGSLEPGKFADFLVIDPTHFAHVYDPYATLVFVAAEPDLEAVYVGGRRMVEHGRPLHQDLDRVEREVNQRVALSLKKPEPPAKWP